MQVLALILALLPAVQDSDPPSAEEVRAALERLEQGFRAEEPAETLATIEEAGQVPADEVAERLARLGLDHPRLEVHEATTAALGRLGREPGRKALERLLRRDRDLARDPARAIPTLRALALHGDPRSVPVLADLSRSGGEAGIVSARILCLAAVRHTASVEALFDTLGRLGHEDALRHMPDLRLALMKLTAVDLGLSREAWTAWWREHRRGFEPPAEEPRLPDRERARWRSFWGLEREEPRPQRREERGR